MDITTAKQIGQRIGLELAFIGLGVAYLKMAALMMIFDGSILTGLFWIANVYWWYHLVVGAIGLLSMSYVFGRRAGVEILVNGRNKYAVGIKYGIITLWIATILGSSVGFFQEGLDKIGTTDEPFEDYFLKPFFWVTVFGFIPTILFGLSFGWQIKKQGSKPLRHTIER